MPEYLSPGVYVEEVDTGAKPIEGVSTSTAGMVGVTERGPMSVPLLLTNPGDYARLFGGLLDRRVFGAHAYLPHAVEGFFRNGGRRLYVSRVRAPGAGPSELTLHDRGEALAAVPAISALLRAAPFGTGGAAAPLLVMDAAGLAAGDRIRVGDGSSAEWHDVAAVAAAANMEMLNQPLTQPLPVAGVARLHYNEVFDAAFAAPTALTAAAPRGALVLSVASADDLTTISSATHLVELWRTGSRELARIVAAQRVAPGVFRLTLARPLAGAHPTGTALRVLTADPAAPAGSDALTDPIRAGDWTITTGAAQGPGRIVEIVQVGPPLVPLEARRVSEPGRIPLDGAAARVLALGSEVEHLNLQDDAQAPVLTAAADAGARSLSVSDRTGLAASRILRIGAAPAEYATIEALPGAGAGPPAGPGLITLTHGLRRDRAAGTVLTQQQAPAESATRSGVLLRMADAAAGELLVTEQQGYAAAAGTVNAVRVTTADGVPSIHPVAAAGTAASTPQTVELAGLLARNQAAGGTVVQRAPLLRVEALDAGGWGDRLLCAIEDETTGLVARAEAIGMISADRARLSSLAGVEPGSVLELRAPDGTRLGALLKVDVVNRADGSVTLAAPLDAAQQAAVSAPGARIPVVSREFRLTVLLRRRDDPAVPSRAETIEDTEVFRQLSMDPRHSRYVETIVGRIGGPPRLWDRRPEGESGFIRVFDLATPAVPVVPDPRHAIRLGPEPLRDTLPSGMVRAARHALAGGDDGLPTLTDAAYLGVDDREPENRTGIFSLRNIDDISIIAAPGQVSQQVQQALIEHCEQMRFRFAVLDGPTPPADAIADVQALRQRYDTKYAAIYYPWLTIPDPLPDNLASVAQMPVPPSGHVIGVYARTDIERGVHKAPANEVVRGTTGLRRRLNAAEQDILNPYPSNINVIRDFALEGRGTRVWGARVATSDPDYKYVPVRRLMIFLEKSIQRGLQWVVFEPNAEPLWARVSFAISSFLDVVWRNGALEGTTPAQAFLVVCDRTTMTQADIDNGRLICLVGVAPVKPAEFVIIRIGLKTATADE
jgi:phage tail sheath protein FI